jgi:2-oxoisovalerate dehydrogenase E1 component
MTTFDIKKLLDRHEDVIRTSLLIRNVEEKLLQLFSEGKVSGTVHTCVGQELIGACVAQELKEKDYIVSNHRGHGHYIARTGDVRGLLAEVTGRKTGVCGGIGGSQHLSGYYFISNGIQGGMAPFAAGIALANKIDKAENITVAFIGDGTLGEGVLYEALNICAIWKLPILFVLENNQYAQSTCMKQTFGGSLQKRVEGFGLRYGKQDAWDLDTMRSGIAEAVQVVRGEQKPCLLEIETYRLNPHSKGDDNRSKEEISEFSKKDILNQLVAGNSTKVTRILTNIQKEVDDAVDFALQSPELVSFPNRQNTSFRVRYATVTVSEEKRINELIYEYFLEAFSRDDSFIMIGEDIEYTTQWTPNPYGGAFKVSRNLSELFRERVRNTPISEAAIVGVGTGLAVMGKRSVVEIMFGDFMTLAFDQVLQHASKFHMIFHGKIDVPLVIRTPMGGKRGYGPTHSQSLEKFFLGIPDLSVVALNHRIHPKVLYNAIYDHNSTPTLVVENKILYTRRLNERSIPGFTIQQSDETFPTIRITPDNNMPPHLTVVCYGGMLEEVEGAIALAFDEEEIICEIICPTLLNPLNSGPIIESVEKTEALLIVEEGSTTASLGSEISAMVVEKNTPVRKLRRMGNNTIIPCSFRAENNLLPHANSIFIAIKELYYGE